MKKLILTFAALAAMAFGQVTYKNGSGGGPNYNWNGVPLSGVGFITTSVVNVTSGNSATLYNNPSNSGKRALVFLNVENPTATTATYQVNRISGAFTCPTFLAATITGISTGAINSQATILEPGESWQAVVSVAGQVNFVIAGYTYDATVPFRAPLFTNFASGNNTIYTVPTGSTALLFPGTALSGSPNGSVGRAIVTGDATNNVNFGISLGGTSWIPNGGAGVGTNAAVAVSLPQQLTSGTAIVFNASATGATSCFIMPPLWERPN